MATVSEIGRRPWRAAALGLVLLGGAWPILKAPAAAGEADPAAVVREVMRLELWYLATNAAEGEDQPFSKASLARFFTPEFAAAYTALMDRQEALQEPLLDGDPILNAQDYCPPVNLTLTPDPPGETEAAVHVSFQSLWCFDETTPGSNKVITDVDFHLVRHDGGWLIDDFDSGGSFRQLITELMKEN